MDLKCRNLDCMHNDKYSCTKEGINVNRRSYCKSYEKQRIQDCEQAQDVTKTMFSNTPKLHPYRHNKTVDIHCKADCLFNHDGKCLSNGISVQNLEEKSAKCATFKKP